MKKSTKIISTLFGVISAVIGLINLFWGNDPLFGLFILILSAAYFPAINSQLKQRINFTVPAWGLLLVGVFIIWASLGVGELFNKIELMKNSFYSNSSR